MQVLTAPLAGMAPVPRELKPFSFLQVGEAMLFVLALFIIYNRERLLGVDAYRIRKSDWLFVPLSFLMLVSNYFLRMDAASWAGHVNVFIVLMSFMLFLMAVFLALGVFGRRMMHDLFCEYKGQLKYLVLFFPGYYFLFSFVQGMWPVFSGVVAGLAHLLLGLAYPDVSYSVGDDGIPLLAAGGFGAKIGAPCSGIESMLLFTSLFLIIIAVDFKKIDVKRAVVVFFPALLGVFLLNVARICALFLVGLHVS